MKLPTQVAAIQRERIDHWPTEGSERNGISPSAVDFCYCNKCEGGCCCALDKTSNCCINVGWKGKCKCGTLDRNGHCVV